MNDNSTGITRRQMLKGVGLFAEEDTGLVHCQTGALSVATQRMFD